MEKKMFFLDLDDTTLRNDKTIPEENITAIRETLDAGHFIAISSGRPPVSANEIAGSLGMLRSGCFLISYNGAVIYDLENGKLLKDLRLPDEYAAYLFSEAERSGIYMHAYGEDCYITAADSPESKFYRENTNTPCRVVPGLYHQKIYNTPKVVAISLDDHDALLDFQRRHREWEKEKCASFFSCPELLEYCYYMSTKAYGIRFFEDYLGIARKNTVAIGDADNDISMIREAGIGVAMNNASEEVKQAADYVTKLDNNAGGVAESLRRFR